MPRGAGRDRRRDATLPPGQPLEPEQIDRGLRWLLLDGVSTQVMGSLTGGALLVAYALMLGASNKVIGLIAAIGPLAQLLQLPSILLIERTRRRKTLVVASTAMGRLFWVVVALIPWIVPEAARVSVLVGSLVLFYSSTALANAAYNSWKRDLVPDFFMARFFAKRLTLATAVGALVTVASGLVVDRGTELVGDPLAVYSPLFLVGGLAGLLGVGFLGRIPEPRMDLGRGRPLRELLSEPLRDSNFRSLLTFLASWNFAINLAAPFFSVYMLTRLGLSMTWILALSVLSQSANILFFQIWGRLADRISNKRVLGLAGALFVGSIALWPLTTAPERYWLTVPLLAAIHLLAGISTAGVNLCAGAITLKLAPRGKAAAFLATNSLASGAAATVAPLLAGFTADALAGERLSLQFLWTSAAGDRALWTPVDLAGLDFLFVAAVLFGLYSLHRLLAVREEGEIEEGAAGELYREMRRTVRHVSNVAGLRRMTSIPLGLLVRPRRSRSEDGPASPEDGASAGDGGASAAGDEDRETLSGR